MLTILIVRLLNKLKSAFWLHFFYYAMPFILAVVFVVLSLNFSGLDLLWASVQSIQGIAAVALAIFTVIGFCRFWYFYTLNKLYDSSVISSSYGTSTNVGQPGDGKTSVSVYDAYINAMYNWSELTKEMYLCCRQLPEWQAMGDTQKLEHFDEVLKAYKFYSSNSDHYIPCLHSNVAITDRVGRSAYKLPITVYEQSIALPYMACCFIDEIGQEANLNVDVIKKSRNLSVSHFFRFVRQFCGGKLFATEQDPANIYIDVRRVAKNRYMLGQHPVLKPKYFGFLERHLLKYCIKHNVTNSLVVRFLLDLKRLNHIMGYRCFRYVEVGNVELGSYEKKVIVTRAIPYYTDFYYNDRYFYNSYLAKDKSIQPSFYM